MDHDGPTTWKGVTYHKFWITADSNGMSTRLRLPKGSTVEEIATAVWNADGINLDVVPDYVIMDMTTGEEIG